MSGRGVAGIAGGVLLLAGLALALALQLAVPALLGGLAIGAGGALLALSLRPDVVAPEPPAPVPAPAFADEDLLGAVDEPMLLVDGLAVTRANRAAVALLGAHVVDEDVRLAIRHPAAAELLAHGAPDRPGSVDVVGLGGGDRYWTMRVQPLGGGRRLVRLTDRTESRAAERMRTDFVANASHELRTPLATLIGFIETLEDANDPADAGVRLRFLGIMAGEARRMQRLVEDLMSLSRIEADRHRAPADAVALVPLAHETADAFGAERARIELDVTEPLPAVAGDRAQLSQLLHNLVGNALKYGDPQRPVRVSLVAEPGPVVRLVVADEGEGIPERHLPRLTERFYRVDPGRSRAVGGTGLGLAIVKHIVERHRGRLEIASAPGQGTRVTVRLPVTREAAEPAAAGDAGRVAAAG